jgi:hypothetical protein
MKRTIQNLLFAFVAVAALSACDIIKGPKVDPNGFSGSSNKVLIEDFTGARCGNCPRAHEQAARLDSIYGDNLVIVAVHAGSFAVVVPSIGYTTDFNTPMGTELMNYYDADNLGLPNGLVNRRVWNGSPITRHTEWSTMISTVLAEAPKLEIKLNPSFSASDRTLTVEAEFDYFTTGSSDHEVVAIITEDSIVAQQEDYSLTTSPQHIEDYVHMHVLRGSMTPGTWGEVLKPNEIFIGEKINKTFTMTLDSAWFPEHCHVVVYVRDNSTQEILQVNKAKVTE